MTPPKTPTSAELAAEMDLSPTDQETNRLNREQLEARQGLLAEVLGGQKKGVEEGTITDVAKLKENMLAKEVDQAKRILGYRDLVKEKIYQLADGPTKGIDKILVLTHKNRDKNNRESYPFDKIADELLSFLRVEGGDRTEMIKGIQMYAYGIDNVHDKRIDGLIGAKTVRALTKKLNKLQEWDVSGIGYTRKQRLEWTVDNNYETFLGKKSKYGQEYQVAKIKSLIRYDDPKFNYKKSPSSATPSDLAKIDAYGASLKNPKQKEAFNAAIKELGLDKLRIDPEYHRKNIGNMLYWKDVDAIDLDDLDKVKEYKKSLGDNSDYINAFNQALSELNISLDQAPEAAA